MNQEERNPSQYMNWASNNITKDLAQDLASATRPTQFDTPLPIIDLIISAHQSTIMPLDSANILNNLSNSTWDLGNNTNTSAGPIADHPTIVIASQIVAWSELVFAILGPPMQIFVLFLGTNVYRRTAQTSQLLVLSMTCGDLLVSSIHSPMMFGFFGLNQTYSFGPCALMYLATYIGCISSSLSLLLLNIDKFIYLSKPLHYHMMVTPKRTAICIVACWAITVAWTLLIIFGPATNFMPEGGCNMSPHNLWVYISFLFVFLSLPSMISFGISLYIRYLVNRHRHQDEKLQRELSILNGRSGSKDGGGRGGRDNSHDGSQPPPSMSQRATSRRSHVVASLRSIAFVFSATIWTCCTVLPYRIGYVIHQSNKQIDGVSMYVALLGFFILLSLNPVGNPIIIIGTQRLYVQYIRKHLAKIFGWQSEYETPSVMTRAETGSVCYNY